MIATASFGFRQTQPDISWKGHMIGNADNLAAESGLWQSITRVLKEGDAIGTFLSLAATRTETGKRALVRSGDDFAGVVGEPEAEKEKAAARAALSELAED